MEISQILVEKDQKISEMNFKIQNVETEKKLAISEATKEI